MRGRVAVIGDLAGHRSELMDELARLGAADDGRLPDDLTVVQVGDLMHRGPDSDAVIALVDRYIREQPSQWVQLVGNHEAQYLRAPAFDWPETIGPRAARTLQRWWAEGDLHAAAAVHTTSEDLVVTHAGITEGFWRLALGRPTRAEDAARAVNSFIGTHEDVLFAAGTMLGGGEPDPVAGPVWASAAHELAPGWLATPMPFSQVHGHSTITGSRGVERAVAARLSVDRERAHESLTLAGGRLVGVDPGHGRRAHRPWRAFVVPDATVLGV